MLDNAYPKVSLCGLARFEGYRGGRLGSLAAPLPNEKAAGVSR